MSTINNSVGDNGALNLYPDVLTIQKMTNNALSARASVFRMLKEDGKCGSKTIHAIYYVQQNIVMLRKPDGRVDPEGLTIRVLRKIQPKNMAAPRNNGTSDSPATSPPTKAAPTVENNRTDHDRIIHLRTNARPVLSEYTKNILRFAMQLSDVNRIEISSTHRKVSDQARIMFNDNMAARNNNQTVREYRGYGYGTAGTAVDKVFSDNIDSLSEAEVKQKMTDEISAWLQKGIRTSKHCVESSEYARNNILDIPYSGLVSDKCDEFEQTLISLANSFNKRKYSEGMQDLEGYSKQKLIDKVIVERSCWHIEIPQDNKPIPRI